MLRACLLAVVLVAGCARLPAGPLGEPSSALANTGDTRLGRALAKDLAANPGRSGI